MNISNLKTKSKLRLGFGIVLFFTIAVASIGFWSVNRYSVIANNVHQLNRSGSYYLDCMLCFEVYQTTRLESFFERSFLMADTVKQELDNLIGTTPSAETREKGNSFKNQLSGYLDELSTTSVLVRRENELLTEMRALFSEIHTHSLSHSQRSNLIETQLDVVRARAYSNYDHLNAANTYLQALRKESSGKVRQLADMVNVKLAEYIGVAEQFNNQQVKLRVIGQGLQTSMTSEAAILDSAAVGVKNFSRASIVVFSIVALLLGFIISSFITRYFNESLKGATSIANKYADGDLTEDVPEYALAIKDEIGDLARAFQRMRSKFVEVISGVTQGAEQIASAGAQSSTASMQMSEGSSEQASGVEEISSTMEEIAANIQQNTENANLTKLLSGNVTSSINELSEMAADSLNSIQLINDKIQIINDIAQQTNILALNAAVESARAGEHGRGFAVVAAEVRKLAENSKLSADEIVQLAARSLEAISHTADKFSKMIDDVAQTNAMVNEIATSSVEQNNGVNQVNNAIQELNRVTQQNAAVSEQLAGSAEQLASQADQLKGMISYFKLKN